MKKALLILLIALCAGGGVAYYLWNKPHENMNSAKADITIEAAQLFNDFNADQTAADAKYLDKTIAIRGTVKEVNKDEGGVKVILETGNDFSVVCTLDGLSQHARTDFSVGEQVIMKGKCTGLNLDVQMERCVEVKK